MEKINDLLKAYRETGNENYLKRAMKLMKGGMNHGNKSGN
jgi:hypothetical protein